MSFIEKPNTLRDLLGADRVSSSTARAPSSARVKDKELQLDNSSPTLPATVRSLRCYKCGDLFNPDTKCRADSVETETCQEGEACLLYRWQKSRTETATVRHCFSKQILLGKKINCYTKLLIVCIETTQHQILTNQGPTDCGLS